MALQPPFRDTVTNMHITPSCTTISLDLTAPAAVFLRLRDRFPRVFLFESSDYHGAGDCRSFVCCDPLAECVIANGECSIRYGSSECEPFRVEPANGLSQALSQFMEGIIVREPATPLPKGVAPGVFGHIAWSAIPYVEQITFERPTLSQFKIPEVHFTLFRYVIACNPFKGTAYVLEHHLHGEQRSADTTEEFIRTALQGEANAYPFSAVGVEESLQSDDEFLNLVQTCKRHIARGDVFQIVPSRRYLQRFEGDDFQVYRALRTINPSPYLFYCDYGGYRLLGSSPEAQISIVDGQAGIFPIAGTYARTGDDEVDRAKAAALLEDPKENAEHCMLVDLARNDLSRHCNGVHVAAFRETHFYSHLIHLVSKVVGTLPDRSLPTVLQVVCDTFPIGTLSGAPKHRAMQILDCNEPHGRGFYGGCIGYIGFNGDVVLGIMIRSLLSMHNTLAYQAGMGVVIDSVPESELAEAHTKLGALRAAIAKAQIL
jgi:anthranilate synthase component 1